MSLYNCPDIQSISRHNTQRYKKTRNEGRFDVIIYKKSGITRLVEGKKKVDLLIRSIDPVGNGRNKRLEAPHIAVATNLSLFH